MATQVHVVDRYKYTFNLKQDLLEFGPVLSGDVVSFLLFPHVQFQISGHKAELK